MPKYKDETMMDESDIDFGFSFENPMDTKSLEERSQNLEYTANVWEWRYNRVLEKINVLLDNLAQSPEKETIRWPNRVEAINNFKTELNRIGVNFPPK